MLTVHHKTQTAFFTLKEYDFSSDFMGEKKITATAYSPDKLDFEVGAYVTYRNAPYKIFDKTAGTKTARTSEGIGDAMKYELVFYSPSKVLETINFEDYVSADDTNVYYTGTPTFDFFNNVTELATRIQANLDRFLGDGVWTITVDPSVTLEEKQVSVANMNLRAGLDLVTTTFGLNYYISGTDITIGGDGGELPTTFQYGKGKGLYEMARIYESQNPIITRLKTYGASRNLPPDYLRDENAKGRYFTQLMLPNFATTGVDYVDAPSEVIAEYGIREGSIIFEDIYPSIEEVNLGAGRIDEIVSVDTIDLESDYFTIHTRSLGFDINNYLTAETPRISIKGSNADSSPTYLGGYEFEIVEVDGTEIRLKKNQADGNILPDNVTTVRAGDRFVLLGIKMPESYITNAENRLLSRANDYFTGEGGIELSYLIKPDEKFIENQGIEDDLDSGKRMNIEDDDLEVANYFTIQNVSIKYGGVLPKYDIKLSNIKAATLKEQFKKTEVKQGNVNAVSNNRSNFSGTNNNITVNKVQRQIKWQ